MTTPSTMASLDTSRSASPTQRLTGIHQQPRLSNPSARITPTASKDTHSYDRRQDISTNNSIIESDYERTQQMNIEWRKRMEDELHQKWATLGDEFATNIPA